MLAIELARAGGEGSGSLDELVVGRLDRFDLNGAEVLRWAAVLSPLIDLSMLIPLTGQSTDAIAAALAQAGIPHAPITPVESVWDLDFVRESRLRTTAPDGRTVRLPPPAAATPHLAATGGELRFPPRYGEHTDTVLGEAGFDAREIGVLREEGVIA